MSLLLLCSRSCWPWRWSRLSRSAALPGRIAVRRGHPQAAAVNVAAWISLITLGALWPLALVWAFAAWPAAASTGNPASDKGGSDSMISFITILYVVAVALVFKVYKVKPRPWPIALFATAGVLLIGGIVTLWTLAAPLSEQAVVSRYVVQIVPWIKGKVLSIPAKPNVPLKKESGILFQIDPQPYQDAVSQAQGQLNFAQSNVKELQATVKLAQASVAKAEDHVAATKTHYDEDVQLQKTPGAISQLKFEQDKESYAARGPASKRPRPAWCRPRWPSRRSRTRSRPPRPSWLRPHSISANVRCRPRPMDL